MDYTKRLSQKMILISVLGLIIVVLISVGLWLATAKYLADDPVLQITAWSVTTLFVIIISSTLLIKLLLQPLQLLSDIVVFAGHSSRGGSAPDQNSLLVGRELVSSLAMQIYDLASMSKVSSNLSKEQGISSITAQKFINLIDLPIIGIDESQQITSLNHSAEIYMDTPAKDAVGKRLYDVLHLNFKTDETFESWLASAQKNSLTASKVWDQVRIVDPHGSPIKQFDLVASFSKQNLSGTETTLCIFDRTAQYHRDDQQVGLVAMAVHELRTPLTIMRGYIEVFEDEIGPTLDPELRGFMHKMQASAQQLTAFVGNILNVARIEENQLVLTLQEASWHTIVKAATEDLALRAGVNGKHIELNIADNLPAVAVDRISVFEVLNNLVDNAIKYSGESDRIVISSVLNSEGMVETSVQDFGIGIPQAAMPDLFNKFYRSHKSSIKVTGTGLGLYLSKAIVNAHGGNIWVRSKEGEGSIFSFTVQTYDQLKHEQEGGENGIMRGAHGWIKNHTMNRQ